jgi:elongation factor G
MREKLRLNAAALQIPIGHEDSLRGLVDLVERRAFHFEGSSGEQIVGEQRAAW